MPHAELIEIDIGSLWVEKDRDLGMKKDGTFLEAYAERSYMEENLRKGSVFWDIGAHVGFFSLFAHQLGVKYIEAFEAHPDNYHLLDKNFVMHGIKGLPWWCAVGNRLTTIDLYHSTNNSGDHMISSGGPTHIRHGSVPMITLDSHLVFDPPDFIKIDVQGSELEVLVGAKTIIKDYKPIIMMEYSPWHIEARGLQAKYFLDSLGTLPYNLDCSIDPYELPSPGYTTIYMEPK